MNFETFDWNVIIVGRWNVSILTPARIAERIFGLRPQEGIPIEVPLDGLSPYRVMNQKKELTIIPENNRIIIQLNKIEPSVLRETLETGRKILEWLPETPCSGAGINIRFKTSDTNQNLIDLCKTNIDDHILNSDLGDIMGRSTTRTIRYKQGKLNIIASYENESFKITFNFHRDCKKAEDAKEWFNLDQEEIEKVSTDIIEKIKVI